MVMATISKKELVKAVCEHTGMNAQHVERVVQCYMDQIISSLSKGHRLEFREFGVFELKRRGTRVARNPKTGVAVTVPERTVVQFRPGKVMKARVADTTPLPKGQ